MSTIVPRFLNTNQNGIPTLSSNNVVVTTTAVQYDFTNHRVANPPFRGLIIFRLAQPIPTGTTTTLPIVFTSDGGNAKPVTGYDGEAVTAADLAGTGVYLAWYEGQTDTLQLLTGIVI